MSLISITTIRPTITRSNSLALISRVMRMPTRTNTTTGISANNVLPVTIRDIADNGGDTLDVTLGLGHDDTGENRTIHARTIHARITQWSATRLKLAIGQRVFAVIKSVTVDGHLRADDL